MNRSMVVRSQLLATKFFVPVASGALISRPRLTALLQASLNYPLTLVSAPAGFGKTMLLSTWAQSLPANDPLVAWVSLDEEDNDPQLFWTYILSALSDQQPERFTSLLKYLQSPQPPQIKYVLTALSNLLLNSTEHLVLILDDYHGITEEEVHTTLSYLVEHLPAQLHIILATRADPSLPLSHLRARGQMLEVRTDQLRCTAEETRDFFREVMGIQFPDETIQEVTARTEGWLVGLQLLGLSLPEHADPIKLLEEATGNQRYILDYLTEEVLRRQPQEVQTFLLSTSILERLTASLCDAVMQQYDSQQMLERLERANLFVVSLDNKRQWYRYHALFAEALRYRLEQTPVDQGTTLHYRASLWYAEHHQTTEAILHAFRAYQWSWAADLIEQKVHLLMSQVWGASQHELGMFRQWIEQLPTEVVHSRPRLCLACVLLLWQVAPQPVVEGWLDMAEAMLTTSSTTQTPISPTMLVPQPRQGQEDLLGEVLAWRAFVRCYVEDGQVALSLCQQALSLLSTDNLVVRTIVEWTRFRASYVSSVNDAVAGIESGLQAGSLARAAGQAALAIVIMGNTACYMIGTGRLHEAQQLTQQAMFLGRQQTELVLPDVGYPALFQGDILREWNKLDEALALVSEGLERCKQIVSMTLLTQFLYGYSMLLRVHLSRGKLDAACSALQEFEHIGMSMNQHIYLHLRSLFTTVDQVKLWLACGELERATYWAETLDVVQRPSTPFEHEREEVARVRIFLAKHQPTLALQRLEPVLQRATRGQRWGHVIEMRLLQALAYQMGHEETQALSALSEAIRLGEPEGYIRSFVDEGTSMSILLSKLQKEQHPYGPTPYLDTLLAAFQQESMVRVRAKAHTKGRRVHGEQRSAII